MRLALYQPDIAQNTGTMMRLAACLGVAMDIIEPCGFVFDDRRLRRAGMDYMAGVDLTRHADWPAFLNALDGRRLVLLSTKATQSYYDFTFRPDDVLLMGRESAGVPPEVHNAASAVLRIPMVAGARSLNVAVAAAMVLGEALRQEFRRHAALKHLDRIANLDNGPDGGEGAFRNQVDAEHGPIAGAAISGKGA